MESAHSVRDLELTQYRHAIYQLKANYCSYWMVQFIAWFDKRLERYNSMNFENDLFHFCFSNIDFLFTIMISFTTLFLVIENIHMQGCASQNFDLGFCYSFYDLI